jgi:hypothetical protein
MSDWDIDILYLTTQRSLVYYYDFGVNEIGINAIRLGVNSIDDIAFVANDEYDSLIHSDEVVAGTMAYFAMIVKDEVEAYKNRATEQHKLVDAEPTYTKRFFFLPDKCNPDNLSNEEFASKAFMFGKVMSMEDYADAFNKYQLGDIHPDMGEIRVMEFSDTCVEMCPHCTHEVILETKFEIQKCPICGKRIAPCNLCDGNCIENCPIGAHKL